MDAQFGKYRIDGVLGTGTMGVVYRAFDQRLQRPVALKTIRSELLDSAAWEQMLERFQHEAVAAGRLIHPNIVTVFDFGVENDTAYIAMELVEGTSLKALIGQPGAPDLHLIGHLMAQLLRALEVAHAAGIVHRDIKPANLMVTAGKRVKVADFGVARIDTSDMTQAGAVVGTLNYMAPEQYAGEAIDGRADLFSAAVILYELITGRRPFRRSSDADGRDPGSAAPPAPGSLVAGVPPELDAVVMKGLAGQPAARHANAQEFRRALEAAMRTLPASEGALESAGDESLPLHAASPRTAGSGSTSGARVAGSAAASAPPHAAFSEGQLTGITEDLLRHVGPIARTLVRKAAREASDAEDLRKRLAECINTLEGKAAFNHAFAERMPAAPSPARSTTPVGAAPTDPAEHGLIASEEELSLVTLSDLEGMLLRYVGPIARVLVRKASKETADRRAFCERLAEHISDPGQRTRFLSDALSRSQA